MPAFDRLGFNLRLSDIQAAVGIVQMGRLESLLAVRRRLAGRYDALPSAPPPCGHTYQSYVIRVLEGGAIAETGSWRRSGRAASRRGPARTPCTGWAITVVSTA